MAHPVQPPAGFDRASENAPRASDPDSDPLERALAHLDLALEAAQMGTWEWDIVHQTVTWSAREEQLYGLAPGTFSGTVDEYRSRIHPDDVQAAWAAVEQALRAGA